MSELRLIILLLGLVLLAGIYFWETIKQRNLQRRQTLGPEPEVDLGGIRISSRREEGEDYSSVISDLNTFLAESKRQEDRVIAEMISMELVDERQTPDPGTGDSGNEGGVDMFEFPAAQGAAVRQSRADPGQKRGEEADAVIVIHIKAPEGRSFSGANLLDVAIENGMEFGEMNIFHHHGAGPLRSKRPLFSMLDMYEPGNFNPQSMFSHRTRGLSLFFCLPPVADGPMVLDLLLDTARAIADRLGGELWTRDHLLLDDRHVSELREKIRRHVS